jgi:hypothetical protein
MNSRGATSALGLLSARTLFIFAARINTSPVVHRPSNLESAFLLKFRKDLTPIADHTNSAHNIISATASTYVFCLPRADDEMRFGGFES